MSGLKINNSNSIFDQIKKEEEAKNPAPTVAGDDKSQEYAERAQKLIPIYKKILDDETIKENKNIFSLDLESENLSSLIKLCSEMNEDPEQKEGAGSTALIALLLRSAVIQRDKINSLKYEISQAQRMLQDLLDKTKKDI